MFKLGLPDGKLIATDEIWFIKVEISDKDEVDSYELCGVVNANAIYLSEYDYLVCGLMQRDLLIIHKKLLEGEGIDLSKYLNVRVINFDSEDYE